MGTNFRIYFPRIEAEAKSMESAGPAAEEDLRGDETILVVEDESSVRTLIRRILESHGYRVVLAEDGRSALRLVDGFDDTIHLLLTDLVMPGMDGYQVAEQVRSRFPDIKVVYTSGYTEESVLRQGLLTEPSLFLQKPFSPRQLCVRLRTVLDAGSASKADPRD